MDGHTCSFMSGPCKLLWEPMSEKRGELQASKDLWKTIFVSFSEENKRHLRANSGSRWGSVHKYIEVMNTGRNRSERDREVCGRQHDRLTWQWEGLFVAFKCFSKMRKQGPLVAGCSKGKYFSLFYYFKMKPVQIILQMLPDRHPKGAIAYAISVQNVLFRDIWERAASRRCVQMSERR